MEKREQFKAIVNRIRGVREISDKASSEEVTLFSGRNLTLKTDHNKDLVRDGEEILKEEKRKKAEEERVIRNLSKFEAEVGDIRNFHSSLFTAELPSAEEEGAKRYLYGTLGIKENKFYTDPETNLSYTYKLQYKRGRKKNKLQKAQLFIKDEDRPDIYEAYPEDVHPTHTFMFEDGQITKMSFLVNHGFNRLDSLTRKKLGGRLDGLSHLDSEYECKFGYRFPDTLIVGTFDRELAYSPEKNIFYGEIKNAKGEVRFSDSESKDKVLGKLRAALNLIPKIDIDEQK